MQPIAILSADDRERALAETERIVRSGGVVAVPTDTVYGLIGSAADAGAIQKIFQIKQRPDEKALPVFVRSVAEARRLAYIADEKARFLERVWPGAVTVIFHHKEKLPKILTGGRGTMGLRIPDFPFLRELLGRVDFPLAQTSANMSGMPPARDADELAAYFESAPARPDAIVDGGRIEGGPSAVVDYTGDRPLVVRAGRFSRADLERLFDTLV